MTLNRGRELLLGQIGETEFERWIVRQLDRHGWCGYKTRISMGVVQGVHTLRNSDHHDAIGFPDWTIWKEGHGLKLRELKTDTGRLSRGQKRCHETLRQAGVDIDVWRPSMEAEIVAELAAPGSRDA